MSYRLKKLKEYVSGWMNYYGISQFYSGVPQSFARMMAGSSKYYSTQHEMPNKWLEEQGLVNIKGLWCKCQGYK